MSTVKIDAAALSVLRNHAISVGTLMAWSDVAIQWAHAAEAALKHAQEEIEVLRSYGNTAMADEELARRRFAK